MDGCQRRYPKWVNLMFHRPFCSYISPPQCHLPSSESFIPKADPVAAIPPRDDVTSSAYVLGEFGLERSYYIFIYIYHILHQLYLYYLFRSMTDAAALSKDSTHQRWRCCWWGANLSRKTPHGCCDGGLDMVGCCDASRGCTICHGASCTRSMAFTYFALLVKCHDHVGSIWKYAFACSETTAVKLLSAQFWATCGSASRTGFETLRSNTSWARHHHHHPATKPLRWGKTVYCNKM